MPLLKKKGGGQEKLGIKDAFLSLVDSAIEEAGDYPELRQELEALRENSSQVALQLMAPTRQKGEEFHELSLSLHEAGIAEGLARFLWDL